MFHVLWSGKWYKREKVFFFLHKSVCLFRSITQIFFARGRNIYWHYYPCKSSEYEWCCIPVAHKIFWLLFFPCIISSAMKQEYFFLPNFSCIMNWRHTLRYSICKYHSKDGLGMFQPNNDWEQATEQDLLGSWGKCAGERLMDSI